MDKLHIIHPQIQTLQLCYICFNEAKQKTEYENVMKQNETAGARVVKCNELLRRRSLARIHIFRMINQDRQRLLGNPINFVKTCKSSTSP